MSKIREASAQFVRSLTVKEIGAFEVFGSMTFQQAFEAGAKWALEEAAKVVDDADIYPGGRTVTKAVRALGEGDAPPRIKSGLSASPYKPGEGDK